MSDDLGHIARFLPDEEDNCNNCGTGCKCDDCKKVNEIKEFDTHSAPPEVGKCPQCYSGKLVALFGPRRYCNVCGYKE